MDKKDQNCSNCYFWGLGRTTNAGNNACRFFPPSKKITHPSKSMTDKETLIEWIDRVDKREIVWIFPETHKDIWCGQWKKEEKEK